MKRILLTTCAASVLLFSCSNEKAETETAKTDSTTASTTEPVTMPDSATMMKNWEAYMTPGPMHAMMAKDVGNWDGDVTMWMSPDAPPSKSTMSSEVRMIFNGLYQEGINKGNFNGMPFEGRSIVAYNNATKKFEQTWIDNFGTGIMFLTGTYDSTNKSVTMTGTMFNPMTMKECTTRQVLKYIDDNTQMMEMYDNTFGPERKTMEIKMTRRK